MGPAKVRLAVPGSPPLGRAGVPVYWRKKPGDAIESNAVLAVLEPGTELCAPEDVSGQIDKLLASDGERVTNRQPLLRITTAPRPKQDRPTHGDGPTGGLEEPSAVPFEETLPSRIVMEPVDKRTHRALVALGAITVVGLVIAALCLPIYLIVGGPTVPAIGGLALAIVAGALAYGERILHERDG